MNRIKHLHLLVCTTTAVLAAWSGPAAAAEPAFHLTPIAVSSETEFPAGAALNNLGQVAYLVYRLDDFSAALKIGDGSVTVPILAEPANVFIAIGGLSDSGRIGLIRYENDRDTGEPLTAQAVVVERGRRSTLFESWPGVDGVNLGALAINNGGTVALQVDQLRDHGLEVSIIAGKTPPLTTLAPGTVGEYNWGVGLNNSNAVAYWKTSEVGNQGLYVWRRGSATRVFDPASQAGEAGGLHFPPSFALNDLGSVAVETFRIRCIPMGPCFVSSSRILRLDDGVITTIATSSEDDSFNPSGPVHLNNRGDVTFFAADAAFNFALYVSDGVRMERVLGGGDVFLGKTVVFVDGGHLNERGQILVNVYFDDGSNAVVLAGPRKD